MYSIKILYFIIEKFYAMDYFQNKVISFLNTTLDAVDSEKDPRNILIMFSLIEKINIQVPKPILKEYAKNFFELLEVYYPIEFVPPKNSPDKITPDQLIDSLNNCFGTNEFFYEQLIEVFKGKHTF
jgi:hypothetical protein